MSPRPESPFAPPPPRRVKVRTHRDPVTPELYAYLEKRDGRCVMLKIRADHVCDGPTEVDHVRASGGLGLRSRSTADNCVRLCRWAHLQKTDFGRTIRPLLLDYLAKVEPT
jgi:hypothetical protein